MENYHSINYTKNNGEDDCISSLPSPPYSEDGIDQAYFSSDEHNESIYNERDHINQSNLPKKSKTISKRKICHTNKKLQKVFIESIKNHDVKTKEKKCEKGSSSKLAFAKIYPNLLNIKNSDTHDPESLISISASRSCTNIIKKKVMCHVCKQTVENMYLMDHLFFGVLKCGECGWKEDDCSGFRKNFKVGNDSKEGCQHKELTWLGEPLSFLKQNFIKNDRYLMHDQKLLNDHLERYLNFMQSLWDIIPWNCAIDQCRIYLSSVASKNCVPKSSLMSEAKRARKGSHLLDLPADGRYDICKEVIEECRECYSKLNIKDFQFYVSTALITTKCQNCDLQIYFVLTPPNGAKPFLEITLS